MHYDGELKLHAAKVNIGGLIHVSLLKCKLVIKHFIWIFQLSNYILSFMNVKIGLIHIELGKGIFTLAFAKEKTECLNIHDVIE